MPLFTYSAFSHDGRQRKGSVDARDAADARRKLKANGLSVVELKPIDASKAKVRSSFASVFRSRLNTKRFFADLSVLMNAGLGIDQALKAMHEAASRSADAEIIAKVLDKLASGAGPAAALTAIEGLPDEAVALVASGERSARLPYVMKVVAADLDRRDAQRKQLIDAAVYPIFLLLMMLVALGVVTFVLVPTLEPIFESSGRDTPLIVALLSHLGDALSNPLVALVSFSVVALLAALSMLRPTWMKSSFGSAVLKLPLLGKALAHSALARYLQTLALLLENAVPLPEALSLAADSSPLKDHRGKLISMREVVVAGKRIPEALTATGLFPRSVISLVAIGDEVNKLPEVLNKTSEILRSDAQRVMDRLLALLTPAITIFLGVLVGGLVISVMTALLSMNELSVQ